MNSRFLDGSGRIKLAVLLFLIIVAAYFVSDIIVTKPRNIRFVVLVPMVVVLLFARLQLVFLTGVLIIFNGFGLLPFNFTVGGVFKTYDLGLMICFLAGGIYYFRHFRGRLDMFRSPMAGITLVFIGYILFEVLLTSIATGQSLIMSLQMGRHFFPVFLYFFTIPILLTSDKWLKLIPWLVGISVAGAFLYVINFNPFQVSDKVYTNTIDGTEVVRRYGGFLYGPVFIVSGSIFAALIMGKVVKKRFLYWVMLAVMALQPIVSFGRGYIIAFFTQIAMVLLNAPIEKMKKSRIIIIASIVLMAALGVISAIQFADSGQLAKLFFSRMLSAQTDFSQKTGTYKIRSKIFTDRMKLVERYPVFGAGLIHPDAGLYPEYEGIISTGHSGYISLLAPLGITGLVLFIVYTLMIYLSALKVIKLDVPFIYKAIALAATGAAVQGYPRMFSTSSFIGFRSLAELAILAAILQVCIYKSKYGYFAPDEKEASVPPRHA